MAATLTRGSRKGLLWSLKFAGTGQGGWHRSVAPAGPEATRGSTWWASIPPRTRFIAGCGSASRGPGYIHFPIGGAFDETYFGQLTAETVQTRYKEGRPYRVWVLAPGKANEALDTAVYALAARHATRVRLD